MPLLPAVSERAFPDYPNFPRTPSDDAREAFLLFDHNDNHLDGGYLARQALDFEPTNDLAACAWAVAAGFGMVVIPGGDYPFDPIIEAARACASAMLAGPAPASLVGLEFVTMNAPRPHEGGMGAVIARLDRDDDVDALLRRYWSDFAAWVEDGVELAPEWARFWAAAIGFRRKGGTVLPEYSTADLYERAFALSGQVGRDKAQHHFGYLISGCSWTRKELAQEIVIFSHK